jgi:hypothetical protein
MRHLVLNSHYRSLLVLAALAAATACGSESAPITAPLPDPRPLVLLKDITIPHLPEPYYHFEYDPTGRLTTASFASDFTRYTLTYTGGRLSEMQNNILVNRDRLVYSYDNAGNVSEIDYTDGSGVVFTRVRLTYDGARLIGLERKRKMANAFVVDKTLAMTYAADGNLSTLTTHLAPIANIQDAATFIDTFENYDTGINVDGFGLLHDEFFDHLILLPRVQLQKGNPSRITRTGDGVNYRVEDMFFYDGLNRPREKIGTLTFTTGSMVGQQFPDAALYTYY